MKKIILFLSPILFITFFAVFPSTVDAACDSIERKICEDEWSPIESHREEYNDCLDILCGNSSGGGGGGGWSGGGGGGTGGGGGGSSLSIGNCTGGGSYIKNLINCSVSVMKILIYLLVSLAAIITIWGAVRFIGAEPGTDRQKWRDQMVYGIIAIAVILSIWALVAILRNTFGVSGGDAPSSPSIILPPSN